MIGEKKPGNHSDATFLSTGSDNSVSEGDTIRQLQHCLYYCSTVVPTVEELYIFLCICYFTMLDEKRFRAHSDTVVMDTSGGSLVSDGEKYISIATLQWFFNIRQGSTGRRQ